MPRVGVGVGDGVCARVGVKVREGRQLSAARTHWGRRGQEKYTERSALVPFKLTRALGVAQASLQERQAGAISVVSGQPM